MTMGERKTSVAQVQMVKGKGLVFVNGVQLDEYFSSVDGKLEPHLSLGQT